MTFVRLLLAAALALLPSLAFAQPIFPPGSRIGNVPPPSMTPSEGFKGFEDRARGAMLIFGEFTVQSFVNVESYHFGPRWRASGEVFADEIIQTAGGPAQLIGTRRVENGVLQRIWVLLTRTDDMTALVIATLPDSSADAYPDVVMRAALASTFIRPKLSLEQMLAALPYRLAALGGFRPLRVGPDGNAAFTFGPNDTSLPAEQPYLAIVPLPLPPPQPSERDAFARRVLATAMNRLDVVPVISSEEIRIGGGLVHQVIAETEDSQTKVPLMVVQWLRFGPDRVIQTFGIARKDQWADVLPRMRTLRDGFERK
jgi:hypothetical protein